MAKNIEVATQPAPTHPAILSIVCVVLVILIAVVGFHPTPRFASLQTVTGTYGGMEVTKGRGSNRIRVSLTNDPQDYQLPGQNLFINELAQSVHQGDKVTLWVKATPNDTALGVWQLSDSGNVVITYASAVSASKAAKLRLCIIIFGILVICGAVLRTNYRRWKDYQAT